MILFLIEVYLASAILTYFVLKIEVVDEWFREEMAMHENIFTMEFIKSVFIFLPLANSLFTLTIAAGFVLAFIDDQRVRIKWLLRKIKRKF